ncbi:VanZ family protein [Cellulomonas humilata]|uniref:Glycopeptide antibiotics resistance protein n=1 Tax=Cellulomonas humilata TaxID=144055 RepID=A0ABU0EII1_9CELL|nr:VanZ family protein [Cellulomonas humilata]MDQ0375076.1 glycopeptide antibiotics resistance protein [Cellulomonas humilata]
MTSTTQEAVAADARALPQARLVALFVVYLLLLTWAVLWKLELPWAGEAGWRIVKLVPFVATSGAGASTPFDVLANLALFVPLGLYLGLLVPSWRSWKVACAAAAASLGLEVAQYVLAVGSSDLTDVVVNTAGALLGLALVGRADCAVLTRVCAIGTVLAVLASALVVASPLRYGPPEDVRCTPSVPCGPPGAPRDGLPRDAVLTF